VRSRIAAKTVFTTGWLAPYWLFALGGLFVLVTLAMPKGLIGVWEDVRARLANRKAIADAKASGASPSDAGSPDPQVPR
jgi:urea transport system permease protein